MTVAVLLAGAGSRSTLVTLTVLVSAPETVGIIWSRTVASPLLRRLPRSQVNVPASFVQTPCDGVAETKVTPEGSASRTTAFAAAGPRLVTVMVQRNSPPTETAAGCMA